MCQFDGGPLVDVPIGTWFLSSRLGGVGRDAPLLSWAVPDIFRRFNHRPRPLPINFVGRTSTHAVREGLPQVVRDCGGRASNGLSRRAYFSALAASRFTAAPRGFGGSSFRLFEAAASGSIPVLVGDIDTRPFPNLIDWESMSLFLPTAFDFPQALDRFSRRDIREMSDCVWRTYWTALVPGRWPELVLRSLATENS